MGTGIFSLIFISGKLLGDQISIYQLMFFRYIAGFTIVCVIARTRKISLRSSKPLTHFIRAIFGTGGALSIIYASAHMPVADATAISLLEGVVTVAFGLILFKDRLRFRQFIAIILCVSGALLMIAEQGFSGGTGWSYWFPAFIALVSAVLFVLEGVLLKIISMRENAITVMFYVNGFAILLTAIPALIYWQAVDLDVIFACFGLGASAILAHGLSLPLSGAWFYLMNIYHSLVFWARLPLLLGVWVSLKNQRKNVVDNLNSFNRYQMQVPVFHACL